MLVSGMEGFINSAVVPGLSVIRVKQKWFPRSEISPVLYSLHKNFMQEATVMSEM